MGVAARDNVSPSASPTKPERVALITGAAGGLGSALVSEFRAQNWNVVAASRRVSTTSDEGNPWPIKLDVVDKPAAEKAVTQILARWQRIDVLINNAGRANDASLPQIEEAAWEDVLASNLKGAFICSQVVLRAMLRQRSGHIINISSFSGRMGARGQANYAAAKAGLFGLTASLAQEIGSRNIRVNAVLPGVLATSMTSKLSSEQMAAFAQANALGRINSVEEVARFVAFLVTTENISGQIFQLDSRIAPWT